MGGKESKYQPEEESCSPDTLLIKILNFFNKAIESKNYEEIPNIAVSLLCEQAKDMTKPIHDLADSIVDVIFDLKDSETVLSDFLEILTNFENLNRDCHNHANESIQILKKRDISRISEMTKKIQEFIDKSQTLENSITKLKLKLGKESKKLEKFSRALKIVAGISIAILIGSALFGVAALACAFIPVAPAAAVVGTVSAAILEAEIAGGIVVACGATSITSVITAGVLIKKQQKVDSLQTCLDKAKECVEDLHSCIDETKLQLDNISDSLRDQANNEFVVNLINEYEELLMICKENREEISKIRRNLIKKL